jgi:hypothetical protein
LQELLEAYEKIGSSDELLVSASTPRTFLMIDRTACPTRRRRGRSCCAAHLRRL